MDNKIHIDEYVADTVKEYDDAQDIGQQYISSQWKLLRDDTKSYFIDSGCYSESGKRIAVEPFSSDKADEIESLESYIGYLRQCANYRLPSRSVKDAIIPRAAFSNEVLAACNHILCSPQWHDPLFLRLALMAFRVHTIANLMGLLPPVKEKSDLMGVIGAGSLILFSLIAFILLIASPYFVSVALVSVAKGDEGSTITAMYLIGFTIYLFWELKVKVKKKNEGNFSNGYDYEFEYNEWDRLGFYQSSWWSTGAGARFYFESMAKKGVNIPPMAIDLCAALESSILNGK